MVQLHTASAPCTEHLSGAPLALYGEAGDTCSAEGCGARLRRSNQWDTCERCQRKGHTPHARRRAQRDERPTEETTGAIEPTRLPSREELELAAEGRRKHGETRAKVREYLEKNGTRWLRCREIAEHLNLTKPTVRSHLTHLVESGQAEMCTVPGSTGEAQEYRARQDKPADTPSDTDERFKNEGPASEARAVTTEDVLALFPEGMQAMARGTRDVAKELGVTEADVAPHLTALCKSRTLELDAGHYRRPPTTWPPFDDVTPSTSAASADLPEPKASLNDVAPVTQGQHPADEAAAPGPPGPKESPPVPGPGVAEMEEFARMTGPPPFAGGVFGIESRGMSRELRILDELEQLEDAGRDRVLAYAVDRWASAR